MIEFTPEFGGEDPETIHIPYKNLIRCNNSVIKQIIAIKPGSTGNPDYSAIGAEMYWNELLPVDPETKAAKLTIAIRRAMLRNPAMCELVYDHNVTVGIQRYVLARIVAQRNTAGTRY